MKWHSLILEHMVDHCHQSFQWSCVNKTLNATSNGLIQTGIAWKAITNID